MLFACDASQLEWRTALALSNDRVGIDEIIGGEDTHTKNQIAFNLPSRLIAKVFLFRTIFRGSGWSFANDPDFMHVSTSAEFWEDKNRRFYEKYHALDKCHKEWAHEVMAGRPIKGPMGRCWQMSNRTPQGELKVPWTTLTNYPVQGTGADVMMLVRIMAKKRIKNAGISCDFISTVHDSVCIDTHSRHIQLLTNIFYQVFDDIPQAIKKTFGYSWTVPMSCECKFGPDMKHQEKIGRSDK